MKISKLYRKQRGAAVVEVAVIMPILLMLTFGAIKYGWLFYRLQQITNITRHATRLAILPLKDSDGAGAGDYTAVMGTISSRMSEIGLNGLYTAEVENIAIAEGGAVTVSINLPTSSSKVDILQFFLLPSPKNLYASLTMSKEGP
ncbi:MAG: pilus assembly protein [Planctomycetaceae bacterium]|nr:pilus assembly protein [Planctomycetaceae bacterium]